MQQSWEVDPRRGADRRADKVPRLVSFLTLSRGAETTSATEAPPWPQLYGARDRNLLRGEC